jgi:mono/diheme cytochrome c family protein
MRRFALLALLAALPVVAACGVSAPTTQPSEGGTAALSPAQKLFADTGCGKCHKVDGVGTGRMDLSRAGAKHDKAWIADHIRDAKQHNPMSTMDAFPADKLSDKDLDTLAEYLAGKR